MPVIRQPRMRLGLAFQVKAATAIIPITIKTSPLISIGNRLLGESSGATLDCRSLPRFSAMAGSFSLSRIYSLGPIVAGTPS
jgi:hypothetical protein